ncbi:hypothetical protein [Lactobacillus melliventris]|uniref:hypothetical protein n=1 Tax=Lactobacillus melliventris TaxID=1218507 RepID=UPI00117B0C98|nr:hypothetical protein [Lactobacillus melliventris]
MTKKRQKKLKPTRKRGHSIILYHVANKLIVYLKISRTRNHPNLEEHIFDHVFMLHVCHITLTINLFISVSF